MKKDEHIKAIGMLSGGLDSVLAAKIIADQGIDIIGLHIITPFTSSATDASGYENVAGKQARELGIKYRPLYLGDEYVELVKNPHWGYGTCMNPCIDCHIYFLKKAGEVMRETEAYFVFTGDVIGQRPMSQQRNTLRMIEKRCGFEGYLLRPLSALKLEPTIPEKMGWVDRERLLGLVGRSRKIQIALAAEFGIKNFHTPAGGCLLTDPGFSARLKDLFAHNVSDINSIHTLKVGRHFRLGPRARLIVGRHQRDNRVLANLALESDVLLEAEGGGSPLSILRGEATDTLIRLAAAITRRYSRARQNANAAVRIRHGGSMKAARIVPEIIAPDAIEPYRIS